MKNKTQKLCFITALLAMLLIDACSPIPVSQSTNTPTQKPSPTASPLPSSTAIPLPSPTIPFQIRLTEMAKRKEIYSISVSPNGKMLALSASYGMQIYNLENGASLYLFENKIARYQGVYSQIAWSPDGKNIAVGTLNFGVRIWDVSTWKLLTEIGDEKAFTNTVFSHPGFAWSPDSNSLILGINPTGLTVDDYKTGKVLIWNKKSNTWNPTKHHLGSASTFSVTWNSNNQPLILEDDEIYDINTGNIIGHAGEYDFAVWSPDKKHLYGHFDLGGDIYDLERKEYEYTICCYAEVAWSVDGRYFAATPEGGNEISIWDSKENILVSKKEQGDVIYAFSWTPAGELLAAGFRDGTNAVWNTNTQKVVLAMK